MKVLPPGSPKYLLIDTQDVLRNKERRKPGTPVACVVEVMEDGKLQVHRGYDVLADNVQLGYRQNDPLVRLRLAAGQEDTDHYAAFYTAGEVRIAETRGEELRDSAFPALLESVSEADEMLAKSMPPPEPRSPEPQKALKKK